jgi:hypothetical protein
MSVKFSVAPGAHERHLMRKQDNPLFPAPARTIEQVDVESARMHDQQDLLKFSKEFQQLLEEVSGLPSHTETELILKIKARVEALYERSCSLTGDMTPAKKALRRLYDTIQDTIQNAAGDDALAAAELADEAEARQLHLALLDIPLVADLLRSDSPIEADELVPTLLSSSAKEFDIVIGLFDPTQLRDVLVQARATLDTLDDAERERVTHHVHTLERLLAHAQGASVQ